MPADLQLSLPFACLDFPDRATVGAREIAAKLRVSRQHILDHIDAGTLVAVDTKIARSRLTGPARLEFIAELPEQTLREIAREIAARLAA